MKITIRKAEKSDIPAIISLVKKLALFEKAPEEVTVTERDYLENGFSSDKPLFESNLAYIDNELVGFSLWYYRFSTWKGKRLYLEDIYIEEEYRGLGIGKILLEMAIEEGKKNLCTGMMWQVLDWNEKAIEFYKKYEVKLDYEWVNVHKEL